MIKLAVKPCLRRRGTSYICSDQSLSWITMLSKLQSVSFNSDTALLSIHVYAVYILESFDRDNCQQRVQRSISVKYILFTNLPKIQYTLSTAQHFSSPSQPEKKMEMLKAHRCSCRTSYQSQCWSFIRLLGMASQKQVPRFYINGIFYCIGWGQCISQYISIFIQNPFQLNLTFS